MSKTVSFETGIVELKQQREYEYFYAEMVPCVSAIGAPKRNLAADLEDSMAQILKGIDRYKSLDTKTGVPWWFIAILHCMESGCRFNSHIHNGDPLTARTVNVPKGRPLHGTPPFAWEDSAIDAFTMHMFMAPTVLRGADGKPDWTLATSLWRFERWNGMGYRLHGVRTPYLWAGSSMEQPGRYIADGKWDASTWSKQIGAAVLLKTLVTRGLAKSPPID